MAFIWFLFCFLPMASFAPSPSSKFSIYRLQLQLLGDPSGIQGVGVLCWAAEKA